MPPRPKSKRTASLPVVLKDRKQVATRPVMLLVLGPHRSGTSLTARMLECLGAENSTNQIPPQQDNPKGFFEDADIYHFNEAILLPSLRQRWEHCRTVDWTSLSKTQRSRLGLQALEILRRNYPLSKRFSVLKEPRINNTLPFWLSLLEHAGFDVRPVCVVRDPVSVARSLQARNGFSIARGGMVYLSAWVSILPHLQDRSTAFVHYDEIFASPGKSLLTVAGTLALAIPEDFEQRVHEFSSAHLDPGMRHSAVHRDDVPLEPDLLPPVIDLYRALLDAAQSQNVKKTAKFLSRSETFLANISPLLTDYDTASTASDEARKEADALRHQQAQLQVELAAARQSDHSTFSSDHSALDSRLSTLTAEHSDLVTRHTSLVTALEELQGHHSSLSAERDAHSSRLSAFESEHSELATRNQQLATALESLQSQHSSLFTLHSSLIAERDSLVQERDQIRSERDTLAQERNQLVAERSELVTRHSSLATKREALQSEHSSLSTLHSSLVAKRDDLATRLSALEADHSELVTRHTALVTEREALQSQHSSLLTLHSSLIAERDDLEARLDSAQSIASRLEENVAIRYQELATLARELTTKDEALKDAEDKAVYRGANGCQIASIELMDSVERPPHNHLNVLLRHLQVGLTIWPWVRVRLVEHHGRAGLVVFESPGDAAPLQQWTRGGEEHGMHFFLLIPQDKGGRQFLLHGPSTDIYFVYFLIKSLESELHQAAHKSMHPVLSSGSLHAWAQIAASLRRLVESECSRFRHGVSTAMAVSLDKNKELIKVDLRDCLYSGRFVPRVSFTWDVATDSLTFERIDNLTLPFLEWPMARNGSAVTSVDVSFLRTPLKKRTFQQFSLGSHDAELALALVESLPSLLVGTSVEAWLAKARRFASRHQAAACVQLTRHKD